MFPHDGTVTSDINVSRPCRPGTEPHAAPDDPGPSGSGTAPPVERHASVPHVVDAMTHQSGAAWRRRARRRGTRRRRARRPFALGDRRPGRERRSDRADRTAEAAAGRLDGRSWRAEASGSADPAPARVGSTRGAGSSGPRRAARAADPVARGGGSAAARPSKRDVGPGRAGGRRQSPSTTPVGDVRRFPARATSRPARARAPTAVAAVATAAVAATTGWLATSRATGSAAASRKPATTPRQVSRRGPSLGAVGCDARCRSRSNIGDGGGGGGRVVVRRPPASRVAGRDAASRGVASPRPDTRSRGGEGHRRTPPSWPGRLKRPRRVAPADTRDS